MQGPDCDATTSLKYHGKHGPDVIRMPAQVPRGNIYQDSEIGGVRHGPFPVKGKDGRRQGWMDQLEETRDFHGTEKD